MENKFKVGDEVMVINESLTFFVGRVGIVIGVSPDCRTGNMAYIIKGRGIPRIALKESSLKLVSNKELPEKWYVKITDENRQQCKEWLESHNHKFNRFLDYWPDADLLLSKHREDASMFYCGSTLPIGYKDYKEITIEQLLNNKQPKETMKTQKISREGLGELYQIVCNEWQEKITSIIMTDKFASEFEVDQNLIKQAYCEASEGHLKVLDKYFKNPKKLVKKEISRWVNIYRSEIESLHFTKELANHNAGKSRIACVELKGTYEIYE